jgi:ribose transport system ATP-binding protein
VLTVENISKQFSGVVVLDNVCMELHAGKVNAIIGENGAGKSTLMRILSGVYTDYDGRILFKGDRIRFSNPKEAQAQGIAIIHQELNLVPYLSIMENIFLGRELVNKWGVLNTKEMRLKTAQLLNRLKLPVDPETPVYKLKVGQQQLVEIAKALLLESEVIIMDEPTSAISDHEVQVLFDIINDLKRENKVVVYISHKLDELFAIADRYIVLRDGKFIEAGDLNLVNHEHLVQKMVGREIKMLRKEKSKGIDEKILSVRDLCLKHSVRRHESLLKNIFFTVSRGEIVGLFGLMGAGRTELLETIFGLHGDSFSGEIWVNDQPVRFKSPSDAIKAGIALVPEDRKKDGLVLGLDVKTNISLTTLKKIEKFGLLSKQKESGLAKKYIEELQIKTSSERQATKNLSGGNQQKIVLAKWLATNPSILLLDEPTRGVDVNAKNEIYKLIRSLANSGIGILMVSSELPEILAISDRVLVMAEGSLTAEFPIHEASEDKVLTAAIPKTI